MILEDTVRQTLIAYIICGGVNAIATLIRVADRVGTTPQHTAPRIIARMVILIALGFLPIIPHAWRLISSLPAAFRMEFSSIRSRATLVREERELFALEARRNLATYDARDAVRE